MHIKYDEGTKLRIRTPQSRAFDIDQHPYLGTIIVYGDGQAYGPPPCATSPPSLACMCAPHQSLRAGVDISSNILHQIQRVLTRQLRAGARSQAHLTKEATAALHARLRVPLAADVLQRGTGPCACQASRSQ